MYDRILVPVDGSECGRAAARYGFAFAAATGATVDIVHVVDTTVPTIGGRMTDPERQDHGEAIVESAAEHSQAFDCPVETHVREGAPRSEIVASADELGADLIVMGRQGTHNLRERLLGGVTEHVVRHADQPVLVVPLGTDVTAASISKLLVPTDGSEAATAAVGPATELAAAFDAEIAVFTAVDVQAAGGSFSAGGVSEEFIERLKSEGGETAETFADAIRDGQPGLSVETIVRRGSAHEEIASCATEIDADLIVMASHGRTGLKRHLLGSVADRVLRVAETPVLIATRPKA
ncbi:universal stress protein [Halapricum desulfuricans]|uniref:Nucleotide-binding protein, UspA family n=1 Tax=Halapricum desulfuricans TaxID=2841257 RepID=A0A897NTT6_9EURY|nr:universal stress protein [Halapricum desulfuricans]QSG13576.1 Nucleotide-binding protein, UspA family [Halapricum desulfuricans]